MLGAEKRSRYLERKRKAPFFLGEGVSAGLAFEGEDAAELARLGLPLLTNAEDLSRALGLPVRSGERGPAFQAGSDQLAWLCYHRRAARVDHYNRFSIPKRSGGSRRLASPKPLMRKAQRWVLEHIVEHLEPHTGVATAWRRGMSIKDNAERHAGKAIVVRIDVRDFFPSIGWKRVREVFQRCGYSEGVATLLSLLCTDAERVAVELDGGRFHVARGERVLPQGACTSPGIANYVVRRLDLRVDGLARSLGFTYSRYADDLIFSHEQDRGRADALIERVYTILRDEHFEPNEKKTAVMRRHRRQMVTGILVNGEPRISRRDCRRFRAIAHQCRAKGLDVVSASLGRDAASYLEGFLAYVHMINPDQAASLRAQVEGLDMSARNPSPLPAVATGAASRGPTSAPPGQRMTAPEEFIPYEDETPMGTREDLGIERPDGGRIREAIERVLAVEAPVHLDRLVRLVGRHFNLRRVHGERRRVIEGFIPEGLLVEGQRGSFVWSSERSPESWRGHRRTPEGCDRKPAEVAPEELRNAAVHVLTQEGPLERQALVHAVARGLGVKRIAKLIRAQLEATLDWSIERGDLENRDGLIGLPRM